MTKTSDKVLVTDFDGTVALKDFYSSVVEAFLSENDLEPWHQYISGKISHFEALRRIFAQLRVEESELEQVVAAMKIDPNFNRSVNLLQAEGWEVIIVSNGCGWYIEKLLARAGVSLCVHTNPGTYSSKTGLLLEAPIDSPYYQPETGVRKGAVVKDMAARGREVAFAGDGRPDVEPALLVPPNRRFARGWLAENLRGRNEDFRLFEVWSEIAEMLVSGN